MLTKQIEGAQRKVEEQNFLIRKRVLEYDDVMNQQREIIYEYRDRILEGHDMSEVAREQIADAIERIGREYMAGEYQEDWELDPLFKQLDQIYDHSFEVDDIKEGTDRETLVGQLREDVVEAYDEREEELGDELMRALERFMLLQIIDERWREHLHDMDYLREGIHLRGFAQIDPLVAYKNEGFDMFTELMNNIWDEFARYVFNVEVQVQPEQEQQAAAGGPNWGFGGNSTATRNLNTSGGQGLTGRDAIAAAAGAAVPAGVSEAGQMAAEVVESPVPVETRRLEENEKVGRNDPCWCGSGKKFKKCHGA
jgi:preprotein translocase subunit SecA